ncbi:hypothetical protein CAAN3_10S04544 [[Candida] anglica]
MKLRKYVRLSLFSITFALIIFFISEKFTGLSKWYEVFSLNIVLDKDETFQNKLKFLVEGKLKNDDKNSLWEINPKLKGRVPTSVKIPYYYAFEEQNSMTKPMPPVQPFDPRFTLGIYLTHYLKNLFTDKKKKYPFHWSDWVDLDVINKDFLIPKQGKTCEQLFKIHDEKATSGSSIQDISSYCREDSDSQFGFHIESPIGQHFPELHILAGQEYLYSKADVPYNLVFLTEKGSEIIPVTKSEKTFLNNGLIKDVVDLGYKQVDILDLYKGLTRRSREKIYRKDKREDEQKEEVEEEDKTDEVKDDQTSSKDSNYSFPYKKNLTKSSFISNPNDIIKRLESEKSLSGQQEGFLNSLKHSINNNEPTKYFSEVRLLNSHPNSLKGFHYDWRFFKGIEPDENKLSLQLHELARTWHKFTQVHGFSSWLAHGSLLAWYWNGASFPWDNDLDVQMPIADLYDLSERFNQSLIVENIADTKGQFRGVGRYLIDVGTSITFREKGNGLNNIDARFIDIDTGVFLDITGLAHTNTEKPARYKQQIDFKDEEIYNCRNNHFVSFNEINPLIKTLHENIPTYIPNRFEMILNTEYGLKSISEINFSNYYYLKSLRIWVETQVILDYLSSRMTYLGNHGVHFDEEDSSIKRKRLIGVFEKIEVNRLTVDQYLDLLVNDRFLVQYLSGHKIAQLHDIELDYLLSGEYELAEKLISQGGEKHPLRKDTFSYKYFVENWRWDRTIRAGAEIIGTFKNGKSEIPKKSYPKVDK